MCRTPQQQCNERHQTERRGVAGTAVTSTNRHSRSAPPNGAGRYPGHNRNLGIRPAHSVTCMKPLRAERWLAAAAAVPSADHRSLSQPHGITSKAFRSPCRAPAPAHIACSYRLPGDAPATCYCCCCCRCCFRCSRRCSLRCRCFCRRFCLLLRPGGGTTSLSHASARAGYCPGRLCVHITRRAEAGDKVVIQA